MAQTDHRRARSSVTWRASITPHPVRRPGRPRPRRGGATSRSIRPPRGVGQLAGPSGIGRGASLGRAEVEHRSRASHGDRVLGA